ncbi:MAG: nitroreductase family protein [Salinivirgaceae bacterium]|nr:nitroreductase family protein [Salinivirgaceae bacterium]
MPEIKLDKCIQCLKCVNDCPSGAINIESGVIDPSCIHCGHCVAICPESTIYPDKGEIKKLEAVGILPVNFENLSATLRTCRSYQSKEIDSETMELLLENMKHYPSASNSRPLEITHVKSKDMVEKLNDTTAYTLIKSFNFISSPLLKPLVKVFAPSIDIPKLAKYKDTFIEKQKPGSSQVCYHAPSVLIFHGPVTKFGMAAADAYIWATYTSIYAHTLGLGTCFNGFISNAMKRSKSMRAAFNIPAKHQVYAALLVGYPKVKYVNQVGREKPKAHTL